MDDGEGGRFPRARLLQPFVKLQNKCLWKITGAYKRTPSRALERDTAIELLSLHMQSVTMRYTLRSEAHPSLGGSATGYTITTSLDEAGGRGDHPPLGQAKTM